MARILVVEDDRSIADLISLYLRRQDHDIHLVDNGTTAYALLTEDPNRFQLIVLDLMLPGLDGRGLCRRVRQFSSIPILMVTALDDHRDKIDGFDLGADDYLTKPFNPDELVVRVRALLRRSAKPEIASTSGAGEDLLSIGNLAIDTSARRVIVAGNEIALRPREFDLFCVLAINRDRVLSRDQLLDSVWDADVEGETRTVDVHVSRLRDRLRTANATVDIETIRSVGYRLSAPR